MIEFLAIANALADENRARAFLSLRGGELCVCQIIELLELAPSTVSKHMQILRQARLVEMHKEGRWIYYRLAGESASPMVREAIDWASKWLGDEAQAKADIRRMAEIVQEDPEAVCRRQMGRPEKQASTASGAMEPDKACDESKCCSSAPATPAEARWRKDGLAI